MRKYIIFLSVRSYMAKLSSRLLSIHHIPRLGNTWFQDNGMKQILHGLLRNTSLRTLR